MITIQEISPPRKMPGNSSLQVTFPYDKTIVELMHQIDHAQWDKKSSSWEIPITSLAKALDLFTLVDEVDIHLMDHEETEEVNYELSNFKTTPFAYQYDGIEYGLNHDKFLLLDAPGLGKTLQIIYLAQELKQREKLQHCLIICGINTLKTNWKKEISKHSDLSCRILGERVQKKTGRTVYAGIKERVEDLSNPIQEFFVIVNIESLRNDDIIKLLTKGPNKFDMIAFDEIHACKNPSSTQGANLLKLKHAKHKIGMTGTLILNSPLDCYVPLKFIEQEHSSFTNYKAYYCNLGGPFGGMVLSYRHIDFLKEQLNKCSLRRTKELLDLPEKTIIDESVDMDEKQSVFYDNIKKGVVQQVDKVHISTSSLLALVTRLRQATACPSILTTEAIGSAKLDRAQELCEQIISTGEKVVVFSTFKETAQQLAEKLKPYNPLLCTGDISDSIIANHVDEFQSKAECPVLVATWQKMGTGITLTAASYAIFIDTPWTDGVYQQAQDRIHRIGAKKPVFIYNLITAGTIDERVHEILTDKQAVGAYLIDDEVPQVGIDSLRRYIEELR